MHEKSRSRRTETAISLILLVCLAGVAAGIYFKQFCYDKSVFSGDTGSVASGKVGSAGLEGLAPSGFTAVGSGETFDRDSLYIKIDGKADLYLGAGFSKLLCQQFAKSSDTNLWIELCAYDMGDGLNAFSVYSMQKRPDAVDANAGDMAYKTGDAVFAIAGKYYLELGGSAASEELVNAMVAAADSFGRKIGGKSGRIAELDLLPKENLVRGSYKLFVKDAYGFDPLGKTFAATYRINGEDVSAFISRQGDASKASTIAEAYKKYVVENGGTEITASSQVLHGAVLDMGEGIEIVFARGNYVAGVHEAPKGAGQAVAAKLYERLGENSNVK